MQEVVTRIKMDNMTLDSLFTILYLITANGLAMCRADVRRHGHHSLCWQQFYFIE
jgi:hypothetical protein